MKSVRYKVTLILSLMLIFFLGFYTVSQMYESNQLNLVYKEIKHDKEASFEKLLALNGKSLEIIVNHEYTIWDEMADYVINPKRSFETEALDILFESYNFSALWVYDTNLNLKYRACKNLFPEDYIKGIPISIDSLHSLLKGKKTASFYTITRSGIQEIRIASIHRTADPLRLTRPVGYFACSRLWNRTYLNELSILTEAKVDLTTNNNIALYSDENDISRGKLKIYEHLQDNNNKTIAHLVFSLSNLTISHYVDNQKFKMWIFIIYAGLFVVIVALLLFKWVSKPLKTISLSLKNNDPSSLSDLKGKKDEFGQLSKLVENFFLQKKQLEDEISQRITSEKELIKATNDAEVANKAKSDFLAVMSHEIRTPMNGVIGMTSLLAQTPLTAEQRDYAETIRISGDNLLGIINDILDFSKIESGRLELEVHPFSLRVCIEEVYDLLAPRAFDKKLDLLFWVDQKITNLIMGDVTRLRQILVNLVGNAIKFTNSGEIVIYVNEIANDDKNNLVLEFVVKDTGIGIPENKISSLFTPFLQVDVSTSRKYGGTGLGLAICSKLVNMMGGIIWAESEEHKGSSFKFTMKTHYTDESIQLEPARVSHPFLPGKRILIVDDNEANRQILSLHCKNWSLDPLAVDSGFKALELLKNEQFDLGIIDMQMPEMDGLTLAREIRKKISKEEFPMIMLTSLGYRDESPDINLLFNYFVSKPIKQSLLFDILTNILSRAKPINYKSTRSPEGLEILNDQFPLNILVAEDNVINQKLIVKVFQLMGYKPDVAANGLEVLDSLERQPYDIIFMDIQMPEMDGYEATRQIIEKYSEKRPFIIAMTANAMQGDREECLSTGMDEYISKPVKLEEVQRLIRFFGNKINLI